MFSFTNRVGVSSMKGTEIKDIVKYLGSDEIGVFINFACIIIYLTLKFTSFKFLKWPV